MIDKGDFGELPTATRASLASFKKCNNAKHGGVGWNRVPEFPEVPCLDNLQCRVTFSRYPKSWRVALTEQCSGPPGQA